MLVISQFTLYADTAKGRRPSWRRLRPDRSPNRWSRPSRTACRALGLEVATGSFGAEMTIDLVLDGPMTILLEV